MKNSVPVFTISLPNYRLDSTPDYLALGKKIDDLIIDKFGGKEIAIRAISLGDHPGMDIDEILSVILKTGTDKYDSGRKSFWHVFDVYKNKGIELFASRVTVDKNFRYGAETLELFFEGTKADRGYSVKLDLIIIYDPKKLEAIPIKHEDGGIEEAWKFLYPDEKPEALFGLIKIQDC